MINRYEVKDISRLWTEEAKFQYFLKVELAHLETLEEFQIAPAGSVAKLKSAKVDPTRIAEIEKTTAHDVIAFCSSITEQFPTEVGRFFHFGVTSSDIIDTAHALLIKDSMKVVEADLIKLKTSLKTRAEETKDLLCIGRSHGIHAEAMIFGQKFLSFYAEASRRLMEWQDEINKLTGQMSGAVGNYTVITPEMEEKTISRLGLKIEAVSTQVIPRDHYAKIILTGSLIASLLERMSTEFRLLQHSDLDEVKEGFAKGQKGSSTMPHKKNPISSENIAGLSRILRSHALPALENTVLWHERDISHSSAERLMLPDHFGLLSYTLRRMSNVVDNLVVDRERIESKTRDNEKIYSSYVLHELITMNPSVTREKIYEVVQSGFFKSQTKEELIHNLMDEAKVHGLKHSLEKWIDFEVLKKHYLSQFQKVLKRN